MDSIARIVVVVGWLCIFSASSTVGQETPRCTPPAEAKTGTKLIRSNLKSASKHISQGRFTKALCDLDTASQQLNEAEMEASVESAEAFRMRALIEHAREDFGKAIGLNLKAAAVLVPIRLDSARAARSHCKVVLQLAASYRHAGDPERSIKLIDEVAESINEEFSALTSASLDLSKAFSLQALGRLAESQAIVVRVRKAASRDAILHNETFGSRSLLEGNLCTARSDYAGAAQHYAALLN